MSFECKVYYFFFQQRNMLEKKILNIQLSLAVKECWDNLSIHIGEEENKLKEWTSFYSYILAQIHLRLKTGISLCF